MKGHSKWSYTPYCPPLYNLGDVHICRIEPREYSIHFEWLKGENDDFSVYYRTRGDENFILCAATKDNFYEINGLETETDYEFFVQSGEKKSRVRLARTGKYVGTIVNYLHPDDDIFSFSGRYLCSPSFIVHPDGYMLAAMDVYAWAHPQNLIMIYRSDDGGKTWYYTCDVMPAFWGKLFMIKGEVYLMAVSTEYGDLLISKTTDGGHSFEMPVAIFRGSNGKNGDTGIHKNPENIYIYNGRLYTGMEWGSWGNKEFCHAAMVASCSLDDDLLVPENWSFTQPRKFDRGFSDEFSELDSDWMMTIEGTVVLSPENKLLNIMRFGVKGKAIAYEIDKNDPEAPLTFYRTIPFPAHASKFTIKYDEKSKRYYSLGTRIYNWDRITTRDLLSLLVSDDLYNWRVAKDIYDYRAVDTEHIGFQYVDFEFSGDDIIFLCRTAINGAHTFHDSNCITFDTIKDFREL